MQTLLVAADAVSKSFGDRLAVDDLDLEIGSGQSLSLLGPNGAGKSTIIGLLTGQLKPTAGRVRFGDGQQGFENYRHQLGVVPQYDTLDSDLTVLDNLRLFGQYFGLSRRRALAAARDVLDLVHLADRHGEVIGELSGGMRRRVAIARALIPDPRLLILDEPTTGLDVAARDAVWTLIQSLQGQGTALLLSTHNFAEAALLTDRVIFVRDGRVVLECGARQMPTRFDGWCVLERPSHDAPAQNPDRVELALPYRRLSVHASDEPAHDDLCGGTSCRSLGLEDLYYLCIQTDAIG